MEFLSEDATYLAGILVFVAAVLYVVLRITQQGKFLLMALGALGGALLVLLIEWVWVTDAERVEARVYALGAAVAASDVPAVMEILDDNVEYVAGENTMASVDTRDMIKRTVGAAKFDFLRITRLRTKVGAQSRRGTAEFHVIAGGSFRTPYTDLNFATSNSSWSLAFKESGPNNWKVVRITPVYIPGGQSTLPTTRGTRSQGPAPSEFGNSSFGPTPTKGRRRGIR